MIHSAKTLNWPYTSCLLSQLYQNWKCCIKMRKSLFGVDSFFYGHHLPVSRKHQLEFHLGLLPWKPWKEIKLSSSTSFAKLDTIERRRSLTSFFSQIRKHQYCVAKKGRNGWQSTKIWRLECQANWTRRGDGRERSYWVIETSVIFLKKRLHNCFSYLRTKRSDQN